MFAQECSVLRILDRPAARCDDKPTPRGGGAHGFLFPCAKVRLTVLREYLRNGDAARLLNLFIEIVKGAAEPSREEASDTRLARPHKADQYNVFHAFCHTSASRAR